MLGALSVLLVASTVAPACGGEIEGVCEAAQRKLDSCSDEIQAAEEAGSTPWVPDLVTDECTALDECLGACLRPATCNDIVRAAPRITDPNAPPFSESTRELLRCTVACLQKEGYAGRFTPDALARGRRSSCHLVAFGRYSAS